MPETFKENIQEEILEAATSPVEYQDKLYLHLRENLSKVKAYALEIAKKVPIPDQCTIEGKCYVSCSGSYGAQDLSAKHSL